MSELNKYGHIRTDSYGVEWVQISDATRVEDSLRAALRELVAQAEDHGCPMREEYFVTDCPYCNAIVKAKEVMG